MAVSLLPKAAFATETTQTFGALNATGRTVTSMGPKAAGVGSGGCVEIS